MGYHLHKKYADDFVKSILQKYVSKDLSITQTLDILRLKKTRFFEPELRFFPHEGIQLTDAVYAYTMGGAKALGFAEKIGSVELGKYANLIHLSHDIFARGVQSLQRVEVLHTFVGGRLVYEKS